MPPLADVQFAMRRAVVAGDEVAITSLLAGGPKQTIAAGRRLVVHHRHYETSLVNALLERFPATVWLAGSEFITQAARRYIRDHPPRKPCIAEYGEEFPRFLAACPGADQVPFLGEFGALEWDLGLVAIAVDQPALGAEDLSSIRADRLPDVILNLQTGLRYVQASWPVDELMELYLTETAPENLEFKPADICIEVRGARGEFHINRLTLGEFLFRKATRSGMRPKRRSMRTPASIPVVL